MADWPYNTQAWQRLRRLKLSASPLCEECKLRHILIPANTVDHRLAIRAGGQPFPDLEGLRSLCASCHSAKTARGEEAGAARATNPRRGCNVDGSPLDPRHAWNDESPLRGTHLLARPRDLRPVVSPLTIVFGAPGSGKSYYVNSNAGAKDCILDLDVIVASLSGADLYQAGKEYVSAALKKRNAALRTLANVRVDHMTWLIVGAPTALERDWWRDTLVPQRTVLIDTPRDIAVKRIKSDNRRGSRKADMIRACYTWHAKFTLSEYERKSLTTDGVRPRVPINFELVSYQRHSLSVGHQAGGQDDIWV